MAHPCLFGENSGLTENVESFAATFKCILATVFVIDALHPQKSKCTGNIYRQKILEQIFAWVSAFLMEHIAHCLKNYIFLRLHFDIKVTYWYPEHSRKISAQ